MSISESIIPPPLKLKWETYGYDGVLKIVTSLQVDEKQLVLSTRINLCVELFLGGGNIELHKKIHYLTYYAHLMGIAGKVEHLSLVTGKLEEKSLEGWQPIHFLALRINYLFWLVTGFNEIPLNKRPSNLSSEDLTRELAVELRTYRIAYEAICKNKEKCPNLEKNQFEIENISRNSNDLTKRKKELEDLVNSQLEILKACHNELSDHMLRWILELGPEEEASYSSGSIRHAVYVSFRRSRENGDDLIIRVDNVGHWSEAYEEGLQTDPDGWCRRHNVSADDTIYPYIVAYLPFEDISSNVSLQNDLKAYLLDLLIAQYLFSAEARLLIYTNRFAKHMKHEEFKNGVNLQRFCELWFSGEKAQDVLNCEAASHNVGLRHRINKYHKFDKVEQEPFNWLKWQEIRTSSTPHSEIGIVNQFS